MFIDATIAIEWDGYSTDEFIDSALFAIDYTPSLWICRHFFIPSSCKYSHTLSSSATIISIHLTGLSSSTPPRIDIDPKTAAVAALPTANPRASKQNV